MKKLKPVHCYLIIALFSFLVFYNTLGNDFVFDDESVVQNYSAIRSLSSIPKFFSAEEGFHKVIGNYYRPVVYTTYTIDYSLWGLNPYGFHLTNNLINLIASLFLLAILIRLFAKYKYGLLASLLATLIFSAHPVHTEAVSWVSGRTDSLVTLFFFAAFYFYITYSELKENKYIILSFVFYALGLMSKEMIVTFPVIIILFDFLWKKKSVKDIINDWKLYSYFIGLTVLYLIIRYSLLHSTIERTTYNYFYGKDFITTAATMLKTIPVYLKLLVFPVGLLYHYNGVLPDSNSFADLNVLFSVLLILVLLILALYFYKNYSKISFIILFVFVTFLPVMNIIPTMNFMAERFLYITSFSFSLLIAYVIAKYINKSNLKIVVGLSILVIVIFSTLTIKRNAEWKDNNTLYSTADGVDGSVLLVNCGNIYANNKQFDEAFVRYQRSIAVRYNNVLAHHNTGLIYLIRGNLDSAEIKFKDGLKIDSLSPDGYFQLANVYQQENRIPEAIERLEKLQSIVPDYRGSKALLENLKIGITESPQMIPRSDVNGKIDAGKIKELEKRSYDFYQQGKYNEAIKDINEMMSINPFGKSGYLNNLALCYEGLGNNDKAKEYYIEAVKIDSSNANALSGLAGSYLKTGDKKKAVDYYKKVLIINPNDQNSKRKIDSLKAK
jgi:protein O-mannosyl-transferase